MTNPNEPWAGDNAHWSDQQMNPYQAGPTPAAHHTGPQPTQQYGQPPYNTGPQPGQQYGPPGQYGQPGQQYGQPSEPYNPTQPYGPAQQYGQPGPQYGQPYPQTQQYPGFPPPPEAWSSPGGEQYGYPGGYPGYPYPAASQPKKRNGLLVGAIAVVVLLVVGAATAFFAFRGAEAGAPTPKEAAVNLVNALGTNDVVGLVGGLAPAEAEVINDYLNDGLDQLKRLEVVKPDTKPEQITGITLKTENLVFDDAAEEKVNDHLTITKLTDGTITVSSDWNKIPLTDEFVKKAFPDGKPDSPVKTETYDISDEIAKNDGEPIRIATVKVDGAWYPSLFYSVADAALTDEGEQWPSQGIAANGADSPEAAVRAAVDAALKADVKRLIELTPPDEMAALHDVGPLLVEAAKGEEPIDASVTDLQTAVDNVSGGKRVRLTKLAVESDGESLKLEISGDCIKMDQGGQHKQLCGSDLAKAVADATDADDSDLTDEQLGAIERAAVGYLHSGVVTTEVDGKWYISPARTFGDLSMGFLRKLQPGDLETLVALLNE